MTKEEFFEKIEPYTLFNYHHRILCMGITCTSLFQSVCPLAKNCPYVNNNISNTNLINEFIEKEYKIYKAEILKKLSN